MKKRAKAIAGGARGVRWPRSQPVPAEIAHDRHQDGGGTGREIADAKVGQDPEDYELENDADETNQVEP